MRIFVDVASYMSVRATICCAEMEWYFASVESHERKFHVIIIYGYDDNMEARRQAAGLYN
jgi:hypothetical protein